MSTATKRRASALKGTSKGGFENVDAENLNQLYHKPASADLSPKETPFWWRIFGLTGKYKTPGAGVIIQAAIMEILGSMLIGLSVGLAKWASGNGGNALTNGAFVGLAYAASYYAASMLPSDYTLRRHLNIAITAGYAIMNEIGVLGFLFYGACQFIGSMCAGGMIMTLISSSAFIDKQIAVPFPETSFTSLGVVIAFEFVGSFVLVLVFLFREFHLTSWESRVKNHHHATRILTILTFFMVLIMFQFQIFTWSNVAYGGGWFSGAGVSATFIYKSILTISNLKTDIFPTSVFVDGQAAALYFLMPIVGGITAAAVSLLVFIIRAKSIKTDQDSDDVDRARWLQNEDEPASVSADIGQRFAQTQLSDMSTPFLQK